MDSEWLHKERERKLATVLRENHLSPSQLKTMRRMDEIWALEGQTLASRINKAYKMRDLGRFLKTKPYERASRDDVQAYLAHKATKLSPLGLAGVKQFLKSFYKDLLTPEETDHPPVVSWIRLPNPFKSTKLPQDLLTLDEVKQLAAATTHPRDKALVMVLYESAARVSEIINLRVGDVEFDEYTVRISLRGKTGERKARLIESEPDLRAWLNQHPLRQDRGSPLWLSWGHQNKYKPLMYDGIWHVIREAAKVAGVKKRVHAHLFRHSRLTQLAKDFSPAELAVLAGWTGGTQMTKIYVHLSGDDVDRKLLEKAGLLKKEEMDRPRPLARRACPKCAMQNSATTAYCTKCGLPLDAKELLGLENEQEELWRRLPEFLKLIEEPGVKAYLAVRARGF